MPVGDPVRAVRPSILLHIVLLLLSVTSNVTSQFVAIPGIGWTTSPASITVTNFTNTSYPSPGKVGAYNLKTFTFEIPAGGSISFASAGDVALSEFTRQKFEVLKFWIQASDPDLTIHFGCTYGGPELFNGPLTQFTTNNVSVASTGWTTVQIPLADFVGHIIDKVTLSTNAAANVTVRMSGYAGNANGTDLVPLIKDVPLPSNLGQYNLSTFGQGGGNFYDYNLTCIWDCDFKPIRGSAAFADVFVQGYRETTDGRVLPMSQGDHMHVDDGVANYEFLWDASGAYRRPKIIGDHPNPYLACLCNTADFFHIGNFSQATTRLVVWLPMASMDSVQVFQSYAKFVKSKRVNGKDTIAVHVRMRVPNAEPYGGKRSMPDFTWNQAVEPKCRPNTTTWDPTIDWLCPDHIFMSDSQMGSLHLGLDRLVPLSAMNFDWFKKTGYDVVFDLLPAVDKILYYSGEYYALPLQLRIEHWHLATKAVDWLHANGKKAPPPIDQWDDIWYKSWTMEQFTNMSILLSQTGGLKGVIPFAKENQHTAYFQYMVFPSGATMLNTAGRCGLIQDDRAEKALNDTFAKWISYKNMTQTRAPWPWDTDFVAQFQKWITDPPKPDPLLEPVWNMGDIAPWQETLEGFTTERGYNGKAFNLKIYPPAGVARINSVMVGISNTARDPKLAHEALMVGFAQNDNLHANLFAGTHPDMDTWGLSSGYRTGYSTPEYRYMRTVWQLDDQELLGRGIFPGYPVQQSQAYGLVQPYDPMDLVFNEIQYKSDRVTVRQSLEHACKIIDFLTLPPCNENNWEPYLSDVPGSNKANLTYRWKPNNVNVTCRFGVAGAIKEVPPTVQNAVPLTYTSISSPAAKAMVAICVIGIIFELTMCGLFIVKRDSQVLRAASLKPSLLIFIGACFTLASVIMRVTATNAQGWFQCYGTYYFFATGFGLVLGSLTSKSYRIDAIFSNSKKNVTRFSDSKVLIMIGAIVLGEVILCLVYEFALEDSSTTRPVLVPGISEQLTQQDCPTSHIAGIVCLYVYNVVLIVVAAYYAFRTRNMVAAFNENVFTSVAIGLISVITVVIVPVLTMINSAVAIFMLIALGTFLATILSTAIFAIPKVLYAFDVLEMADVSESVKNSVVGRRTTPVARNSMSGAGSTGRSSQA